MSVFTFETRNNRGQRVVSISENTKMRHIVSDDLKVELMHDGCQECKRKALPEVIHCASGVLVGSTNYTGEHGFNIKRGGFSDLDDARVLGNLAVDWMREVMA